LRQINTDPGRVDASVILEGANGPDIHARASRQLALWPALRG